VGIIVQNPVPDQDLAIGLNEIPPRLDIDGINKTSIFKASATSEAISRLVLDFSQSGDRVAVVGSMGFVGNGVIELLKRQNIVLIELDRRKGDSNTQIEQAILGADLVVSATGKANLIQPEYLKLEHKLVIDAGFIPQADGTVMGDISKKAYDIPQYLTPVPGGIGPTQMAVLLERIFQVAQIELKPWNYQLDIFKPLQQGC
jgi:methylenetetrahydrofolate dehydrogenase (NADP+) / methenyltetrahydrofolate cyclohydrolase